MTRTAERRISPVFRAMNRPLTILGVERRLFFMALVVGGTVFSLLHSLLGAIGLFLAGLLLGRIATSTDPEILRVLLNAGRLRRRYDPMKDGAGTIRIAR
jgi:type IV secretory pathway VirB3-like protein